MTTPAASAPTSTSVVTRTTTAPSASTTPGTAASQAIRVIEPSVIVKAMNTPGDVALLRNKANTMHCEMTATYAACGSDPLIASRALTPNDTSDPIWWAQVGLSGRGAAQSKADALESMGTELAPQSITPGDSVTYRGFTCRELPTGTTCWNTRTGHGFFISATTIKPF